MNKKPVYRTVEKINREIRRAHWFGGPRHITQAERDRLAKALKQ